MPSIAKTNSSASANYIGTRELNDAYQKHEMQLPRKLKQFMSCLKTVYKDIEFGSKILEEYYEEIMTISYKKILRKCLKMAFIAMWWQMIFATVNCFQRNESNALPKSVVFFVTVLSAYGFTTCNLKFGTIKFLFVVFLSFIFTFISYDPKNALRYDFDLFSPAFESFLLLMTITSIKFSVLLPVLLIFLINTSVDLELKLASCFWSMQNESKQLEINGISKQFQYNPAYLQIYREEYYTKEFLRMKTRTSRGYLIMTIACVLTFVYIRCMNQLRRRTSFLRLGQSVHARRIVTDVRDERVNWISFIMPTQIVPDYMKFSRRQKENEALETSFLPVFARSYNDVTILCADISGYKGIKKSAIHYVRILHDLFSRFDDLCVHYGCEKMSSIGDCYSCICGCPDRNRDHANNCIELGLDMCAIITEFNARSKEGINIRIGINSGRVNAAVVGRQRFRFDVYSCAVIIASEMKNTCSLGKVHISQYTFNYAHRWYRVIKGNDYQPQNTGYYGVDLELPAIKTFYVNDNDKQRRKAKNHISQLWTESTLVSETTANQSKDEGSILKYLRYCTTMSEGSEGKSSSFSSAVLTDSKSKSFTVQNLCPTKVANEWDSDLITAIRKDPEKQVSIFFKPPIHPLSLCFCSTKKEQIFRKDFHCENITVLSSTCTAFIIDCVLSTVFHIIFTIGLLTLTMETNRLKIFEVALTNSVNVLFCIPIFIMTFFSEENLNPNILNKLRKYNTYAIRNIYGCILPNMPFVLLLSFYESKGLAHLSDYQYSFEFFIAAYVSFVPSILFHSCSSNIHNLCNLLKLICLIIMYTHDPNRSTSQMYNGTSCEYWTNQNNCSECESLRFEGARADNPSSLIIKVYYELCMICFAAWLVNRENEIIYRLCYYIGTEAEAKSKEAQNTSREADDLLHNIVPKYVIKFLQRHRVPTGSAAPTAYIFEVPMAAVSFACVSNFFKSYYKEDYKGGEFALALLHNIISTFDSILDQKKYKDIEKIRTVNDCYILAAGLNAESVGYNLDDNAHLYALMEFCFEMLTELQEFNLKYIVGSEGFSLNIGYHVGPVVAGIIGTRKPMLDIWGKTVDVANDLYLNSKSGSICVIDTTANKLHRKFLFKSEGYTKINGKTVKTFSVGQKTVESDDEESVLDEAKLEAQWMAKFTHPGGRRRSYNI